MTARAEATVDHEDEIIEYAARFSRDPEGWVDFAFPWGEGELAGSDGPRDWQREAFREIGQGLRRGYELNEMMPVLLARASGHGIGKSAFFAMLYNWGLSTLEDTKAVITANTESQLRTKTWPEIAKWFRLSITAHWWNVRGMSIVSRDEARSKTWRLDAITWSETNLEAFQGLHNLGKRILIGFDEASGIPDKVWEVAEGILTDENTEIVWVVFGNFTQASGRFAQCFGRERERWRAKQIDSRDVPGTNKKQIQQWIDLYGEDSDFVRVRVRGLPPRAGSMQLIGSDMVERAIKADPNVTIYDPLVIGVDVARYGDDKCVIRFRRGMDARSIPPIKLRGVDTMTLAGRVASAFREHKADMVFVDETGIGAGVIDRLRQLHIPCIGVNFGSEPDSREVGHERVARKDAEMWVRLREALKLGLAIDDDPELRADLEGRQYGYNAKNEIILEKKDDMKRRGLQSPDDGDALALTFAHHVEKRHPDVVAGAGSVGKAVAEYDPFSN